jgi:glycosyltransferase involved in cell wall biosynthesis
MKVLILHSELGVLRGGGENFTRSLFTAFAERGHQIDAAFVADLKCKYPIPLPAGIRPIPMAGWWWRDFAQRGLSAVSRWIPRETRLHKEWDRIQQGIAWRTFRWHTERFQHRVERRFKKHWSHFDAAYVHGDPVLASQVARHLPTILFLPGPVTAEFASKLFATQAVCSNGHALLQIRRFLGNHAIELPVGLDHEMFKPGPTAVRQRLRWSEDDPIIGYVGRLHHIKGVDLLASAFRYLVKSMPNARLLMVGSGNEERNIRSELSHEISRGVVHLERDLDHVQLPEWYRAMDLVVMPSRYENFSNTLLEAMACEKPFLGADVGGNRMMAETGAGWLFKVQSASSLTSCLRDVLENKPEMIARGKAGGCYVRKYYNWAASAECLEDIINSHLSTTE